MQRNVFYSWQSDLPNATNRSLIEDALAGAGVSIAGDETLEIEPVIDRDVLGIGGSPDISKAIFEKIEGAHIFVADVSIINSTEAARPMPNPNVLIELGYALRVLGPERVVLVMNKEFGGPELLPFDLKMRRAVVYSAAETPTETRTVSRAGLQTSLEAQLRTILKSIPIVSAKPEVSKPDQLKALLVNPNSRIELEEFVNREVQYELDSLNLEKFPVAGVDLTKENIKERLEQYHSVVSDLDQEVIVLARWAEVDQIPLLERLLVHIAETEKSGNTGGYKIFADLGWYPLSELIYAAGMAAISAGRYDILKAVLTLEFRDNYNGTDKVRSLLVRVMMAMAEAGDGFKKLDGLENKLVPRSEYMFEYMKTVVEKSLVLGKGYERLFDRFEVLLGLVSADLERGWGPSGRFGWKHGRGYGDSPLDQLIEEATAAGNDWPPLKAGLFGGSLERFTAVAKALRERVANSNWF